MFREMTTLAVLGKIGPGCHHDGQSPGKRWRRPRAAARAWGGAGGGRRHGTVG